MSYALRERKMTVKEKIHYPKWLELLMIGQKIQAIKAFRDEYKTDLKTSKDVIDGFRVEVVSTSNDYLD